MAYLDSAEDIEKNPHGRRLREGWQLVMPRSVRLNEFNDNQSIIIEIENEFGETGNIWLDGSNKSRPLWAKLKATYGLDWGAMDSPQPMIELLEKHVVNKECDVLVAWGKKAGSAYVNDIAEAGTHSEDTEPVEVEVDDEAPVAEPKTKM